MPHRLKPHFYALTGLWLAWSAGHGQASAHAVRGLVRDSVTGARITGAVIEIRNTAFQASTHGDEVGEFRLDAPAGTYRLSVRRIGYAILSRDLRIPNADTSIVVVMSRLPHDLAAVRVRGQGSGIFGVVGTSLGLHPIPGAKVNVAGANQHVATDSAGQFFVEVKPGSYVVRISRAGYSDEVFPLTVGVDEVVDASRLLDASDKKIAPGYEGLWQDFDQRLRWRGTNSALVTGSDLRHTGGGLGDALRGTGSFVAKGLRVGEEPCIFVNGVPKPKWPLSAFSPDEIEAVELYGPTDEAAKFLAKDWPGRPPCAGGSRRTAAGHEMVQFVVIWTKR